MTPTVSVVIPTFNGGRYIRETIDSVLGQTLTDFEIIVVDDGSDPPIRDLLAPYGTRLTYLRTDRKGPAAARNAGVELSKGRYLALLDHDDLWHRDNLKVQVEILDRHPLCSLVYSYPTLIDEKGAAIPNEGPSFFPTGDVLLDFLRKNRITTFSAALIRASVLESVGQLDESPETMTCDDYDLWLRIAEVADIIFVPGDWVQYRIHPGNLLKNRAQNLRAHQRVLDRTLTNSARLGRLPRRQVLRIANENRYETLRRFAYIHYYQPGGIQQARALFWKAVLLKPYVLRDLPILLACYLPNSVRSLVRAIKRSLPLAGS